MSNPVELTAAEQKVLAAFGRNVRLAAIATTQGVDESWAQEVVDRYAVGSHLVARDVARKARIVESHDTEEPTADAEEPTVVEVAAPLEEEVQAPGEAAEPVARLADEPSPLIHVSIPLEQVAAEVIGAPAALDPATYPWPETAEQLNLNDIIAMACTAARERDVMTLVTEIVKRGMELAILLRDRQHVANRIPTLAGAVAEKLRAEYEARCVPLADEILLGEHARTWARANGIDCPFTGPTPPAVIVDYLEALLAEVPDGG